MRYARLLIDRRVNGHISDEHACHMVLPLPFDGEGVGLEVIQCSSRKGNCGRSLIRITDSTGAFEKNLEESEYSNKFGECSISKISKNKYIAAVSNNKCRMAQILAEYDVFLTSAIPKSEYEVEWTLFAAHSSEIHNLIRKMNEEGYKVELLSGHDADFTNLLTERQYNFVKYAYDYGYYDVPKLINVDDLSEHFKCSKSTASVILRSAEHKLITFYFMLNRNITPPKK